MTFSKVGHKRVTKITHFETQNQNVPDIRTPDFQSYFPDAHGIRFSSSKKPTLSPPPL